MTHRSPQQDLYQDPDWEPEDMSMYHSFPQFPMPFMPFPTYYPGIGDDWGYDGSTNDAPAPPDDHDDPVLTTADLMDDQDDTTVDNAVEDTEPEDLLMAYQAHYEDENGPSVPDKLALFVNKIWRKGRDPETFKITMAKHPRPENLVMQKVEVNPEVLSSLGRVAKSRDAKLKSVQAGLARATVPAVKIAEQALRKNDLDKKQVLDLAVDSVTLLANVNKVVNQVRRDSMRPGMQAKFQELCRVPETEDTTKQLFGNNLQERIKVASQGGQLGRRGGMYPYPSFPGRGRGRGYMTGGYSGYNPYMSMGRGFGRGRPFLGKEATVNHEPMANDYNANSNQTIDIDKYDTIVSLSPCRPQGQEPGATPQHQGTNEAQDQPKLDKEVGKFPMKCKKTGLSKGKQEFQAGSVSNCAAEWAKITSDFRILSNIRGYKLEFNSLPIQDRPMAELPFSKIEKQFIKEEICRLLDKGVIVKAAHCEGEFVSNIFLREKQEPGNFRMILNLKHLNKYVDKKHFKMKTFMTTLSLVTPGCSFLSFDFADAYYSCSIFPPHRKYFRFKFQGQLSEFTCLPNGLTSAPRFFTKIVKVALTHLRQTYGMTISGYLDDNLLVNYEDFQGASQEGAHAAELFRGGGDR